MPATVDVLIRGAEVYDGNGNQAELADVAIEADRIADVGSLDSMSGRLEIDARGFALAPGFIDVHTHDDFAALAHRDMGFKSRGGVTTCIVGNCGFGAAPFTAAKEMLSALTPGLDIPQYDGHAGYADILDRQPPGINIGALAGHGTFRKAVTGDDARDPSDAEMKSMKSLLDEALEAGVLGLSSGLIYEPGRYAKTSELVELASQMRGTGAIYATHMRDEAEHLLSSVSEAISIGSQAGVPVQISHHKASGRDNWGLVKDSVKLIEAAQGRGENVHADQYPYTAGSTNLKAVLQNGVFTDGASGGFEGLLPDDMLIATSPDHSEWEGRTIANLSAEFNLSPLDTCSKIVAASPWTTVVLHMMSEADVQFVLQHPSTMIGSDGIPTLDGRPHPRLYNSFARVIGHYARDSELFDIATAIHRMTGLPADKFGLTDRGRIAAGSFADLVLFDPDVILDKGTYEEPNQYPVGIKDVFVNGVAAVSQYQLTDSLAGRVLRRKH
ncbi:MAG: N-acyl-D-amino-acid deacylase family protein [Woeseiaceae bacterium]